ncbi:hypothetical protein [Georgenia daeguensis]|uniref:Uncharacterized protein n=1 Tax=Georgenia daeguensis TaxID=908355 RepID=A0ABP8EP85_9MICO
MNDIWLYLHDVRARDLEEEARRAMHRRAAGELRRRERELPRRAAWARVAGALRGREARVADALRERDASAVPCPAC